MLKLLLDAKASADIKKTSAYGTPLESAHAWPPGFLVAKEAPQKSWLNENASAAVYTAAREGNVELLEDLITRGPPITNGVWTFDSDKSDGKCSVADWGDKMEITGNEGKFFKGGVQIGCYTFQGLARATYTGCHSGVTFNEFNSGGTFNEYSDVMLNAYRGFNGKAKGGRNTNYEGQVQGKLDPAWAGNQLELWEQDVPSLICKAVFSRAAPLGSMSSYSGEPTRAFEQVYNVNCLTMLAAYGANLGDSLYGGYGGESPYIELAAQKDSPGSTRLLIALGACIDTARANIHEKHNRLVDTEHIPLNNSKALEAHPAAFTLGQVLNIRVDDKSHKVDSESTIKLLTEALERDLDTKEVQQAAESGPERLRQMLGMDSTKVLASRGPSGSVLHWAVNAGCVKSVELLLNAKIDPDLLNAVRACVF